MTEDITEECSKFFKAIFKKLDQIKERQIDLLDCLHNQQLITGTVWESVLISQGKLKREWKRRTKKKKRSGQD